MTGAGIRTPWLIVCAAVASACSDSSPRLATEHTPASEDRAEADPAALEPIPVSATPGEALERMAKKYAADLVPEGEPLAGHLDEGGRTDHLAVLKAGHCYRALGAGAATVSDMDLFLYDPNGVPARQDPGEDRFPVLGLQADICPRAAGAYRIQVHMYDGGGAYEVRLFRTP